MEWPVPLHPGVGHFESLASTVSYDGIVLLVDVVVFDANAAVVADGGDNVVRYLGLSGYGML